MNDIPFENYVNYAGSKTQGSQTLVDYRLRTM